MSFFCPKNWERNERFLFFLFSFFYFPNTKYTKYAKFYSCWILGATGWCAGTCHHLGRHRWSQSDGQKGSKVAQGYPQTERGGVRYETPNRRWLDGSGPHWCRTRATTGLLMFLLLGATGNHQSWAETGLCGLFRDLQRPACPQRHGLFPWRKTEERKRQREESQTESAPAQQRSGEGVEDSVQSPLCLYKALCSLLILQF